MKKQSNLQKLLGYAGKYRFLTYGSWILSALSSLVAMVPFWYLWRMLREVLRTYPNFEAADELVFYGWMAVLFAVAGILVYLAALMCSHLSAFRIASNLRKATLKKIAALPLGFVEDFGSGKIRKIVNESSAATEAYLAHQLPDKAGAVATPIGLLILLFAFDYRLGLLSLAPVVLGFAIMASMTGKKMEQKMREYQSSLDQMSNESVEYIRGIPVVKTFGQTVFSFKKFKGAIDAYEKWVIEYTVSLRLPMMLYTAAINGVFAFLIAGAFFFAAGDDSGSFLLNLLFYIIVTPVISLTLTRIMFMSENAMIVDEAMGKIETILHAETLPYAEALPYAETLPKAETLPQGASCMPGDSGVTLSKVRYSYDGEHDVIKDVSLQIKPGQTVAFVGPSGGGKSTLANLICRFFDVKEGSIAIGGADVRAIPKEVLMDRISFVFQNSRLIKGSIYENVKLAKPEATREECMEALRLAQCMDIIHKFPTGIDTVIGSEGVYLSGGEMQRIAIARAMLKNAPVLILDEATAFADPDNELQIQKAFDTLAQGKTVIMIAHRLSTVTGADQIYVLADGQIAEHGTWQQLVEKKGLFSEMWEEYQTSVSWKVQAS